LGCAVFAFYAIYATKWVIENAVAIGAAWGLAIGLYLTRTSVGGLTVGLPLIAFVALSGACLGLLLRSTLHFLGYLREEKDSALAETLAGTPSMQLFVIGAWGEDSIAVVRARDPEARLMRLQVGHSRPLRVLAGFPFDSEQEALEAERRLRRRLHPMRGRGEWYAANVGDVRRLIYENPGQDELTARDSYSSLRPGK
jgi:hypothetical protein